MAGLERWQDAISQNIANTSVAGYKAVGVAINTGSKDKAPEGNDFADALKNEQARAEIKVNFAHGVLVPSDNPMDCAINGDGFFEIQDEEGGTIYTRNGRMHVDSENHLVDASDRPVMGSSGVITLNAGSGNIRIDSEGQIYQGAIKVAKLSIVSIDDTSTLIPAGGGYTIKEDEDPVVEQMDDATVTQGFYEASNVAPMREMIDMISSYRAYEANQRVVSNADSMLGRAISAFSV